jgi:hypothetical protein
MVTFKRIENRGDGLVAILTEGGQEFAVNRANLIIWIRNSHSYRIDSSVEAQALCELMCQEKTGFPYNPAHKVAPMNTPRANPDAKAAFSPATGSAFRRLAQEWLNVIDPNERDVSDLMKLRGEIYKQCAKELLTLVADTWPNAEAKPSA